MTSIICMGVSGVGKSTVGQELARRLGGVYLEGDDFHPAANKSKMAQGVPLQDADRWDWLDVMNRELARHEASSSGPVVLACSALKHSYRERLCRGLSDVRFVYLKAPYETIAARLAGRRGHYMPPSLLSSQFAALEEPDPHDTIVIDARAPVAAIVDQALAALGLAS